MEDNNQQSSNDDESASRYTVSGWKSSSIRQMTPNQFYKVCPTDGSAGFGPPLCGDGTPFCFFVSRSRSNTDKLLVEIMGGGACWNEETCSSHSELLTFPSQFDSFLGLSCSEIQVLGIEANGMPINMLCAGPLGETDLSQYNSIIIPYCTQDVHVGNNAIDYAGDGSVVYHYGARNIQSVLTWIFKNFKRPTDICLTGCSAGGTAVLPVYRAFHNQYNGGLNPLRTQINAIADSPVYLTPQYFLSNALDSWLPNEYFDRLGIPYDRYRSSEEYSTMIWDFVLQKGSNKDRLSIVSHTDDPVSQMYYQWMSGSNGNNGNDVANEWYQQLTSSIGSIQSKHNNLKTYWIDGQGHCSFGLYYALQESSDFAQFAGDIFSENNHSTASRLGLFYFLISIAVAAVPIQFLLRRRRSLFPPDGLLKDDETSMKSSVNSLGQGMISAVESSPYTAAYGISITVYFLIMMFNHGFVHPLDNPSLGPSANALSAYGINNPSLVVLNFQWFRLISSSFVCSGVLAFGYVIGSLWWRVRPLEVEVGSSGFLAMVVSVLLFINAVYCLFGQGASTSSVGMAIGLRSVDLAQFPDRVRNISEASIKLFLEAGVFGLFVPFNNWILLLAALLIGPTVYLSRVVLQILDRGQQLETRSMVPMAKKIAFGGLIMFSIVILVVASPDPIYKDPFYTGCRLFWSDQVEDLSGSVFNSDNDDEGDDQQHRRRNLIDYDGMCAQFCIPNLVAPLVGPIVKVLGISAIAKGQCMDNGYETRSFTKTFSYATYALDVDVYYGTN